MVTKNQIKVLTTNMGVKIEKSTSPPAPSPTELKRGKVGQTWNVTETKLPAVEIIFLLLDT